MEKEKEKERLYIPVNIATRFEFLPGLGLFETFMAAIAGVIAALFSFLLLNLYQGTFLTAVVAVGTALAFRKNEINMSIVDYIRHSIAFTQGQKKYPFRWYHKYSAKEDEDEI